MRSNWKSKPRVENGPGDDSNNACRRKPAATAGFFPLSQGPVVHRRRRSMSLRTQFGVVQLEVVHGQDRTDRHWGCPIRERWGLSDHRQLSLAFEDRLAFTATATGSYAEAAEVARRWGAQISSATVHQLVQRQGRQAEAATRQRLAQPPREQDPQKPGSRLGVLMLDGWLVRQRGPGWGKRKTTKSRVEWHEWKTGVYYPLEQSGQTAGERGLVVDKVVVGWQGEPAEFGQRLHWEALRQGLGRARKQLVVADGAVWIWNLVAARWTEAEQVLDFYHASQHLWEIGRALHGTDEAAVEQWATPLRHRLRHGGESEVLRELARLKPARAASRKTVRREVEYFRSHAKRIDYQRVCRRGWPIGSGPVESACRQRQCRFKRPGQSWTREGMRHLASLIEARHNHHWEELWETN